MKQKQKWNNYIVNNSSRIISKASKRILDGVVGRQLVGGSGLLTWSALGEGSRFGLAELSLSLLVSGMAIVVISSPHRRWDADRPILTPLHEPDDWWVWNPTPAKNSLLWISLSILTNPECFWEPNSLPPPLRVLFWKSPQIDEESDRKKSEIDKELSQLAGHFKRCCFHQGPLPRFVTFQQISGYGRLPKGGIFDSIYRPEIIETGSTFYQKQQQTKTEPFNLFETNRINPTNHLYSFLSSSPEGGMSRYPHWRASTSDSCNLNHAVRVVSRDTAMATALASCPVRKRRTALTEDGRLNEWWRETCRSWVTWKSSNTIQAHWRNSSLENQQFRPRLTD